MMKQTQEEEGRLRRRYTVAQGKENYAATNVGR